MTSIKTVSENQLTFPAISPHYLLLVIFLLAPTSAQQNSNACNPEEKPSPCGVNAVCAVAWPNACELGTCMCQSPDFAPLYANTTDCGRLLKPGDKCKSDSDEAMLIPEFAQCEKNVVTCTMGLVAANGTCTAAEDMISEPGGACDDTVKCNGAILLQCSRLSNKGRRCECASNLIFKEGRCQPALFGDACTNDDQCNVIYSELPGATRSICKNGTCTCGDQYIKVNAVVRTSPSSTLLRNQNSTATLGYYCFSSAYLPRMVAKDHDKCSLPLPREPFDPAATYCAPGLVCLHCAESGPLSRGICKNITIPVREPAAPSQSKNTTRLIADSATNSSSTASNQTRNSTRPIAESAMNSTATNSSSASGQSRNSSRPVADSATTNSPSGQSRNNNPDRPIVDSAGDSGAGAASRRPAAAGAATTARPDGGQRVTVARDIQEVQTVQEAQEVHADAKKGHATSFTRARSAVFPISLSSLALLFIKATLLLL